MAWELVTQAEPTPWVQWIDEPAAEGWRAVLSGWVGARVPQNWSDQARAVRSIVTAHGGLALACDLPTQSYEPWARPLLVRDCGPDPLPIGYPSSPWRLDALERIKRNSEDAREWAESQFITDLAHRIGLSRDGVMVDTRLDAQTAPDTPRGADYRRIDAANYGGSFWGGLAWTEWYPPVGAAERVAWSVSVVPLSWHWEQAQEGALICGANDVRGIVSRSRAWVKAKNLLTAKAIGGALPEDIVTALSASLELRGAGPPRNVRAIYGTVAAAISLAVPLGPAIALIASGIIEGLYALGGAAIARQDDLWGRREPVLETERLTGVVTTRERRAPTHTVPRNWSEHACPDAWRATSEGSPVGPGGNPFGPLPFVPFSTPLETRPAPPPPPPPPPSPVGPVEVGVLGLGLAKLAGLW